MMKKQKTLAFLIPDLEWGGLQRVVVNLVKEIANQGIPVDLVAAKAKGVFLKDIPPQVRLIDFHTPIAPRLKSALNVTLPLVRYMKQEQPVALVANLYTCNVVAILAKMLAFSPVKLALVEHIYLYEKQAKYQKISEQILPFLMRRFYSQADRVIAVSQGLARDLETYLHLSNKSIHPIYNPVLDDSIQSKAEMPINHPWFQSGEPPVILGIGRLVKQKDFSTLIKAFALVRKEKNVRLVILGEGGEKQQLLNLAQQLGIDQDLAILDFVDNPYAYMKKAAVFVLSSAWEGFGNVLVEAIAVGIPVVSTNCPSGPQEILNGGEYGKLVPVGDSKALAQGIFNVLSSNYYQPIPYSWLTQFTVSTASQNYLNILGYESTPN